MSRMLAKAISRITVLSFGTIVGLGLSMPAFGAEGKFDNKFCFVSKSTALIDAGDGYKVANFEAPGIMVGSEGEPFAKMEEHCVGHYTIIAGQEEDSASCEAVDAAGDKVFVTGIRKFDAAKPIADSEASFRILHGTGKFAGVTGEGKSKIVEVISRTPERMAACSHSTGTYQIK
jgi:hypothetical protein